MKKLISCFLSLAMVFSLSCTAFAATAEEVCSPSVGGLLEATEEEMAAAAQLTLKIESEEFQAMLESASKARASWVIDPLTYYGQERKMSCGPACVRMSLKTLTGTTYTESTIRNGTDYSDVYGTTMDKLVSFMNSQQSIADYQPVYGANQSLMMNCIFYGVYDLSLPIIGVVESSSAGFPYNGSGGHAILAYGVYSDLSKVQIADPWAGYVNDTGNATYALTASQLYSGYNTRNLGLCY